MSPKPLLKVLRTNRLTAFGAAGVAFILLIAVLGPTVAPFSVSKEAVTETLRQANEPPGWPHLLGTDWHGADVFTKILLGARISMAIGLSASALTMLIGLIVGVVSGYAGGMIDSILMRATDLVMAFPSLLLAILIAATMEPGLFTVFLALTLVGWTGQARVVRSLVLQLKEQEFVQSAVAAGAGPTRIVIHHILPNCASTLIVLFTLRVGITLLAEASLNFLGLGAPSSAPSWGVMVFRGMDYISQAPWISIAPATAIAVTVLSFNFLGDGLRDALDPRLQEML